MTVPAHTAESHVEHDVALSWYFPRDEALQLDQIGGAGDGLEINAADIRP